MLFADVVATSQAVASTRARSAKVASLASLLQRLSPAEIEPVAAFLTGRPRQGKIGIGWATLQAVDLPPAATPTIEVLEIDEAVTALHVLQRPGAGTRRHDLLGHLPGLTDALLEWQTAELLAR